MPFFSFGKKKAEAKAAPPPAAAKAAPAQSAATAKAQAAVAKAKAVPQGRSAAASGGASGRQPQRQQGQAPVAQARPAAPGAAGDRQAAARAAAEAAAAEEEALARALEASRQDHDGGAMAMAGSPARPSRELSVEDIQRILGQVRDDFVQPATEILANAPDPDMGAMVDVFVGEAKSGIDELQRNIEVCMTSDRFDLIEEISTLVSELSQLEERVTAWKRRGQGFGGSPDRPVDHMAEQEAARRQAEADAERRHAQEEEASRQAEEERRRAEEAEAQRRAEAEEAEARRRAEAEEAERRRKAEEEARRQAEEQERARQQAEEEARRKAQEEARRAAEEARRRAEEEEEARRRKAEEEAEAAKRAAEERARQQAEEDARQRAMEAARLQAEEEARRHAEEEARKRAEQEAKRREEELARQKAEELAREEAQRKQEEERMQAQRKLKQMEEQARKQQEREAAARMAALEQERRQREQEAEEVRQKAEQEARRREEEAARVRAEEEAQRRAVEMKREVEAEAAVQRAEKPTTSQAAQFRAGEAQDAVSCSDDDEQEAAAKSIRTEAAAAAGMRSVAVPSSREVSPGKKTKSSGPSPQQVGNGAGSDHATSREHGGERRWDDAEEGSDDSSVDSPPAVQKPPPGDHSIDSAEFQAKVAKASAAAAAEEEEIHRDSIGPPPETANASPSKGKQLMEHTARNLMLEVERRRAEMEESLRLEDLSGVQSPTREQLDKQRLNDSDMSPTRPPVKVQPWGEKVMAAQDAVVAAVPQAAAAGGGGDGGDGGGEGGGGRRGGAGWGGLDETLRIDTEALWCGTSQPESSRRQKEGKCTAGSISSAAMVETEKQNLESSTHRRRKKEFDAFAQDSRSISREFEFGKTTSQVSRETVSPEKGDRSEHRESSRTRVERKNSHGKPSSTVLQPGGLPGERSLWPTDGGTAEESQRRGSRKRSKNKPATNFFPEGSSAQWQTGFEGGGAPWPSTFPASWGDMDTAWPTGGAFGAAVDAAAWPGDADGQTPLQPCGGDALKANERAASQQEEGLCSEAHDESARKPRRSPSAATMQAEEPAMGSRKPSASNEDQAGLCPPAMVVHQPEPPRISRGKKDAAAKDGRAVRKKSRSLSASPTQPAEAAGAAAKKRSADLSGMAKDKAEDVVKRYTQLREAKRQAREEAKQLARAKREVLKAERAQTAMLLEAQEQAASSHGHIFGGGLPQPVLGGTLGLLGEPQMGSFLQRPVPLPVAQAAWAPAMQSCPPQQLLESQQPSEAMQQPPAADMPPLQGLPAPAIPEMAIPVSIQEEVRLDDVAAVGGDAEGADGEIAAAAPPLGIVEQANASGAGRAWMRARGHDDMDDLTPEHAPAEEAATEGVAVSGQGEAAPAAGAWQASMEIATPFAEIADDVEAFAASFARAAAEAAGVPLDRIRIKSIRAGGETVHQAAPLRLPLDVAGQEQHGSPRSQGQLGLAPEQQGQMPPTQAAHASLAAGGFAPAHYAVPGFAPMPALLANASVAGRAADHSVAAQPAPLRRAVVDLAST
eukprot:TRINITY_DN27961_c0_g1_i1.p1 TRINITY_DN27961_c0_g1~~TRINITY_DN27961_c0_g1_i1.p1  ORF type:complete len:1531 (+),score=521.68 TRINITY_DN27961_c0_g1_i1:160-4752(+)